MDCEPLLQPSSDAKAASESRPRLKMRGITLLICFTGPSVGTELYPFGFQIKVCWNRLGTLLVLHRSAHICNPASALFKLGQYQHIWAVFAASFPLVKPDYVQNNEENREPAATLEVLQITLGKWSEEKKNI